MAEIHQIFVFEVALGIDLDQAERTLAGAARQSFRHRGRATTFLHYRPAPLRVSQEGGAQTVGRWCTRSAVDLVLYDFGAVSVAYQVNSSDDLEELRQASAVLRRSDPLRQDARLRVAALLQ